jgi:hypothetical protein
VHDDDVHNFDETSFQIGIIGLIKVVTDVERRAQLEYATPPFIIYKGRVHISAWYEEANIPRD